MPWWASLALGVGIPSSILLAWRDLFRRLHEYPWDGFSILQDDSVAQAFSAAGLALIWPVVYAVGWNLFPFMKSSGRKKSEKKSYVLVEDDYSHQCTLPSGRTFDRPVTIECADCGQRWKLAVDRSYTTDKYRYRWSSA